VVVEEDARKAGAKPGVVLNTHRVGSGNGIIAGLRRAQDACGEKYSPLMMYDCKREAGRLLHEYAEDREMQEMKLEQQRKIQKQQPKRQKEKSRDDWER